MLQQGKVQRTLCLKSLKGQLIMTMATVKKTAAHRALVTEKGSRSKMHSSDRKHFAGLGFFFGANSYQFTHDILRTTGSFAYVYAHKLDYGAEDACVEVTNLLKPHMPFQC